MQRKWSGTSRPVSCSVLRAVRARVLWEKLMRATYDYAEPGVIFIDRVNRLNNLWYREQISATNPCGELPLPPYGACNLGSVNLVSFVREPFSKQARLDVDGIRDIAAIAVRMLDNVIDVSQFPLSQQAEQARGARRIGLGVTGLADALIMLGLHYGEAPARELAGQALRTIRDSAYRASIELSREKGPFPFFEHQHYLEGEHIRALPTNIREGIDQHGVRNSHLTAVAPTGTISLLANNVSSGIEPVYDFRYRRQVLGRDGATCEVDLNDHALECWRALHGAAPLPHAFVSAQDLSPAANLDMQAAIQPYVDSAISKTINVPSSLPFRDFETIYAQAYERGLKGCTTFRPNPITGAVLTADDTAPLCCTAEREAD